MVRRNSTPPANLNADNLAPASAPGIEPPPGVQARVRTTIDYDRPIDPDSIGRGGYRETLDELANEELTSQAPIDPLTAFCEEWVNYAGHSMVVMRLPDSHPRRVQGQTYARPYFAPTPENLGVVGFDPNPLILIPAIQAQNGNSGGTFQLWLIDMYGRRVQDAIIYSYSLGDPPPSFRAQQQQQQSPQVQYVQPQQPVKSEAETHLENVKNNLFERMLNKALEDRPAAAQAQLPPEQAAQLYFMQNTSFFETMFTKMTEASRAIEAPAAADWKGRFADAAVALATNNPAILERVSGIFERIVARVLPDPKAPQYIPPPQPVFQAQQSQLNGPRHVVHAPPPPKPDTSFASVDDNADEFEDETPEEIEARENMEILDEMIILLNSDRVLTPDEPVFVQLQTDYPERFALVIGTVQRANIDQIIEFIKSQSDMYASMLSSPGSGPYLRKRLTELKALIDATAARAAQTAVDNGKA